MNVRVGDIVLSSNGALGKVKEIVNQDAGIQFPQEVDLLWYYIPSLHLNGIQILTSDFSNNI